MIAAFVWFAFWMKLRPTSEHDVIDRRLRLEKALDLFDDRLRALTRGIVGELDEHPEVPLVLAGNEPTRDGPHEDEQQGDRHREGGEKRTRAVDHATGGPQVALGHRAESRD